MVYAKKKTICDDPELGFMLTKSKWNRGFATEIAGGFLEYAFNSIDQKKSPRFYSIRKYSFKKGIKKNRNDEIQKHWTKRQCHLL